MSPNPVTVDPGMSSVAALDLMDKHGIRHLPVMERGRLVGVVSDRNLLAAPGEGARTGDRVADVLTPDPVTVAPDDGIVVAAVEVILRGIGCLPVMQEGKLTGIVTEMDLLQLYVDICVENELVGDLDPPVAKLARKDAITVTPDTTLQDAQALRDDKTIRHFPVVEGSELRGMLSDRDLRRAQGAGNDPDSSIEALMTRPVQTVNAAAPLSAAAKLMLEYKITGLPVRFDDGLGIVSAADILDHSTAVLR